MKLIFTNNYYYIRGGSEKVFFDELEMLNAHGHEVIPFSAYHEKNISSEYSKFFAPPIEYENISFIKKAIVGCKLIYSHESKKKFFELIECFKPDLIHAHNIYGRLTTSIIDAIRKKNIPVVITLHDYKLICPSYLMLFNGKVCERCKGRKFYNCVFTKCHRGSRSASFIYAFEAYFSSIFKKYDYMSYFICPSRFSLKKHAEAGIPEEKLIHIPNFVNIENFEPSYENKGYILYAGRLSREKGVLTLLKAVKGLDIPVKIVGDGPMRKEYEEFVKQNSLNNVLFEGYKSGDELKELFLGALFLVFPSEWYENAPMTILEAFALGKPVIGSNIGGVPEMIIDEQTGLLFKHGDYQEFREKIKYLFSNPSIITQMGMNARKKVENEYNAELHYQRLMKIYEEALYSK